MYWSTFITVIDIILINWHHLIKVMYITFIHFCFFSRVILMVLRAFFLKDWFRFKTSLNELRWTINSIGTVRRNLLLKDVLSLRSIQRIIKWIIYFFLCWHNILINWKIKFGKIFKWVKYKAIFSVTFSLQ